jgi:YfiR/HmsC-like
MCAFGGVRAEDDQELGMLPAGRLGDCERERKELSSTREARTKVGRRGSSTRELRRKRGRRGQWAAAMLAAFVLLGGCWAARGQESGAGEYQVKAAFLFHFAQFVEWPPQTFSGAGAPLTYCTVGDDPFRGALDQSLTGKMIGGRELRVLHFRELKEAQGCQILFLGSRDQRWLNAAIASVGGSAVLTVGETDHFVRDGGIIGFCQDQNKIRFEINLEAAGKAKLKISAKLLALAKTVIGDQRGT